MSQIDLVPATGLASRHIDRLREDERRTRRQLAKPKPPSIEEYRNVFVDESGRSGRRTAPSSSRMASRSARLRRADVPNVAMASPMLSRTVGIYHWLIDRLPTIAWTLRADAPAGSVLIAEDAPGFERQTLDLAGLDDRAFLVAPVVFVERLTMGRVGFAGLRYWDEIAPIVDRIREHAVARPRARKASRCTSGSTSPGATRTAAAW